MLVTLIRGSAVGKAAEQCYCESEFLLILELLRLCGIDGDSCKLCSCLPCQSLAMAIGSPAMEL